LYKKLNITQDLLLKSSKIDENTLLLPSFFLLNLFKELSNIFQALTPESVLGLQRYNQYYFPANFF